MKKLHVRFANGSTYLCPPTHHFNDWYVGRAIAEHGMIVPQNAVGVIHKMVAEDTIPAWEEMDEIRFQPMLQSVVDFLTRTPDGSVDEMYEKAISFMTDTRDGTLETTKMDAWKKHISWLS